MSLSKAQPLLVVSRQQVQMAEESDDSDEGPGPSGSGLLPSKIATVTRRFPRTLCQVQVHEGLLREKNYSSTGDLGVRLQADREAIRKSVQSCVCGSGAVPG